MGSPGPPVLTLRVSLPRRAVPCLLEERNSLGRHFDPRAGPGIAAHPSLSLSRPKGAEAADLDLVAALDRLHHPVEDAFYDDGSFFGRSSATLATWTIKSAFVRIVELNAGV